MEYFCMKISKQLAICGDIKKEQSNWNFFKFYKSNFSYEVIIHYFIQTNIAQQKIEKMDGKR